MAAGLPHQGGLGREMAQAADVAVAAGVSNLAAWGFEGCDHMSAIRPDRPDEVWRVIGETFRRLR